MPTCPSLLPSLPCYCFHPSPTFSLHPPLFLVLSLSISLSPSPSIYLSFSLFLSFPLSHYPRHRGRNPIHTTLSVPHSSSRNVPSRLNPHNPSPFSSFTARSLTSSPPPASLPACLLPSRWSHPRHCASFHPQPSVSSRSFQQRYQWRDQPFFHD